LVLTLLLSFTGYCSPGIAGHLGTPSARTWPKGHGAGGSGKGRLPNNDVSRHGRCPMIHAGSDARIFSCWPDGLSRKRPAPLYVLHCVFLPVICDGADRDPFLANRKTRDFGAL